MKLTPRQECYAIKLWRVRHEAGYEFDENGVDLSLIRENLRRTPEERLRRMNRFGRLLTELLPGQRERLESWSLTREMRTILEDYSLAKEAGDVERIAMLRWFAERVTADSTNDGALFMHADASAIYSAQPMPNTSGTPWPANNVERG